MLDRAFLETADYRTLIETSDRVLVVGRRGTGKSALAHALNRYWQDTSAATVKVAPEEYEVIGLRPLAKLFGSRFSHIRAGMRLIWRYALMMETALALAPRRSGQDASLGADLNSWRNRGTALLDRVRHLMKELAQIECDPEARIGDLPVRLDLKRVEDSLTRICEQTHAPIVFLIDKLDEGYEPDLIGIGLVDGLVQAGSDLKVRLPNIRPALFLRDNMFRAVQTLDPDYSRNVEGQVLRLHWDESALLDFAAARLKLALGIQEETSQRVWNACTSEELRGRDGFTKCLRLTLYRPRDVLALLNQALYTAHRAGQARLNWAHIEATAQLISQNRLDDLVKEYSAILPGLRQYIALFQGKKPERDVGEITSAMEAMLQNGSDETIIQQDFFIMEDAKSIIRGLYSVGLLGVKDPSSGRFIFCHDGRAPDREFQVGDTVLIHPCYWMALNVSQQDLDASRAEEIHDEYDIEISSETPDIRKQKIDSLISQLDNLPDGGDGDSAFETWCHKAVRICFAKSLRNVELKPNKLAKLRRDVVATNLGDDGAWKRIREDYGTRQVVFEIKNYKGLTAADYQQVLSYLSGEYGRMAFVVTRDETVDLYANKDVEWVREMYATHQVLIVKLTGNYLRKLLYKLRNPQKHDTVDDAVHTLLDTYTRLYIAGQTISDDTRKKRLSRKKKRKLLAAQQKEAAVTEAPGAQAQN